LFQPRLAGASFDLTVVLAPIDALGVPKSCRKIFEDIAEDRHVGATDLVAEGVT
jgi:hypothetical protein